jgi:hypothetical protein
MTHMEVRALRQRVLPGMTDEVVSWLRAVAASPADALAGLAEEGIVSESFFLERNLDGDYVVYVARANNMAEADRRFETSSRFFDVEARRFWDSHVTNADTLELIADLNGERE